MRKALVILISALLILSFAGCTQPANTQETEQDRNGETIQTSQGGAEEQGDPNPGVVEDAQNKLKSLNASNIALGINAYNALNPNSMLPDGITMEEAKEALVTSSFWPKGLSDEQAKEAWKLIVYKDGTADLTPEAKGVLGR